MHSFSQGRFASGGILIMTLVFVAMFVVIFLSLAGLANRTYHETVLQAQDETAFHIAESGLNYARWRLAHNNEDLETEVKTVTDQFAGDLGSFEVTFEVPFAGSNIIIITSVGMTASQPARKVTLQARYGILSLAQFSQIVNEDVWYGPEETVYGPAHANGGIRMDGFSDSLVTSAKETYTCQSYHACSGTKPGVWGDGPGSDLWEFPVPQVDYNSLTLDLLSIKDVAQTAGTYVGPSGSHGYHIVFNSDNTYSLYRVTAKTPAVRSCAYTPGWSCQNLSHDIASEVLISTQAVPSGGVIFVEDTLWLEGDIRDRVTVAAGVFPDTPSTNVDVIFDGSISYGGVHDGTRVLGVIAQRNLLFPYSGIPDEMTLDGAYIAQKGAFMRRYYPSGPHRFKDHLDQYGMTASNGVPTVSWVSGGGTPAGGYASLSAAYDSNLLYAPPPYFPTYGEYQFISWDELSSGG